tara:strand:+ start:119 stop:571 length:453 start_codon:yes stop_codon:yes gene_type:complete
VKLINYFLVAFIFIFLALSFLLKPVHYSDDNKKEFPTNVPEVQINIPLNDELSLSSDLSNDLAAPETEFRTNFSQAWTVKVDTYSSLEELEKNLKDLKQLGYQAYSRYENTKNETYALFIGPTLIKDDSLEVLQEVSRIGRFNPSIKKYD